MARPKGSKNKPKTEGQTLAAGIGHNLEEMSDEQRQALFFQHVGKYRTAFGKKKVADAELKNICKIAKAELGKNAVLDIKDAIAIEDSEDDSAVEAIEAEIERKLRVARWMGAELGAQFDLFLAGQGLSTPHKAYEAGKRAALKGEPARSPYAEATADGQDWLKGHHDGIAALRAKKDEEAAKASPEVTMSFAERLAARNKAEEHHLRDQATAVGNGELPPAA